MAPPMAQPPTRPAAAGRAMSSRKRCVIPPPFRAGFAARHSETGRREDGPECDGPPMDPHGAFARRQLMRFVSWGVVIGLLIVLAGLSIVLRALFHIDLPLIRTAAGLVLL